MEDKMQHISGDPTHSFLKQLRDLVNPDEAREFRRRFGNIKCAEVDPNAIRLLLNCEAYGESSAIEGWRILDAKKVVTRLPSGDLVRNFARGKQCPTINEIRQIALYYGMPRENIEAFCLAGKEYIEHCNALPVNNVKAAARTPEPSEPKEYNNSLQGVLQQIIDKRYFIKEGNKIGMKAPDGSMPKDARPLGITYIRTHIQFMFSIINGKHNFKKKLKDSEAKALNEFLTLVKATPQEIQSVDAALEEIFPDKEKDGGVAGKKAVDRNGAAR